MSLADLTGPSPDESDKPKGDVGVDGSNQNNTVTVAVANKPAEGKEEDLAKAKEKEARLQHKGPEARARDLRVAANNELYEHLSDNELEKVLPKTSDGKVTSIGAMLHSQALCAVCIFHHTAKGCYNGMRCKFCHAEHEQPTRPKRKRREGKSKDKQDEEENAAASGEAGEKKKRKRARRRRGIKGQDGEHSSEDGSPQPARLAETEYGSAWGGTVFHGGRWPSLDERGNSRPCWLQDEPPFTSWPYGWPMLAARSYGYAPLPCLALPPPVATGLEGGR